MEQLIQQIITLSKARIESFLQKSDSRYEGSSTYFRELRKEVDEALAENTENNSVYLEDELGDIFWDYIMLLNALTSEGKITSVENVFERCYQKFSERINKNGNNA
ncbi:MAG: nucleotide pyrophosphohydrolase [Candidatus Peribacteria bacterium]|jgi:NTP pyrophosphatase (non-canonical NTP hydrolase)|nr:nucleotide pyrophosphohydrolase [Candidatus Peribacteria bacterium]